MIVDFPHERCVVKEPVIILQENLFLLEVSCHILLANGLDRDTLSERVSEVLGKQTSSESCPGLDSPYGI